ncbi:glycosylhydrolase-like jelly roll fold domain-containing protein [Saccharomonospora sp. NPDC046836]|uniref:glycosylhydrolase-like jelly roll fold domain-containing protein n=1 Tax=Saccharomonospora sp. NPDC046836 TaxID=3156921 RepID=UPI0033C43946
MNGNSDHGGIHIVTTGGDLGLSRRSVLALVGAAALAAGVSVAAGPGTAGATPARPEGFVADWFAEPRPDSRPTVLWFWNGTVTEELIRTQLADMRDKGVHEVLVFPFETAALRPEFFSEGWFTLIEFTLREAQREGMHVWLFNDSHFPSGRAGGFVVAGGRVGDRVYPPRPELGVKGVGHQHLEVVGGSSVRLAARALSVSQGRLIVDAAAFDGIRLLRAGAEWRDYDVRAKVRVERATAGLMVRSPDAANGLLVDLLSNGEVDVWRQQGGGFSLLRKGRPVDGFDPAADHLLTVSVRGPRIDVSVDEVALPPIEDGVFVAGRVGVRGTASQRSSWDSLTVHGADGAVLYAEEFGTDAALDGFDLAEPSPLIAAAARPQGSSDLASLVDLTEIARAGGMWTVPDGQWRVDLFPLRELAQGGGFGRNYLDLLDDEAVRQFLDIVPGEYLRRFPWAVGSVLRGFADDEPFIASARAHFNTVPWSPSLDDELDRLRTRPGIALTAVHEDLGADGLRLRGVFWRAVSDRFAAAYHRRQGEWVAQRGLKFISNPLWDEYGPGEQVRSAGNLNTTNQWSQVPGTDLIFDHYQRGYHRTLPRWPASTAHQLGLERVYLEAMGGTGWQVTPALTREVVGAFAVRGANHTLLHASFTDEKQIVYPPPFQPVNPWWEVSAPLNEWIGRLMEACRATAKARTVLVQPQRAAETYQDTEVIAEIDDAFRGAAHSLEDVQVDFDFLDEGALDADPALVASARPSGPRLVVGRQAYRIVVLPQTPILALGAVETLSRFVRGGGTLVAIGELPTQEAGGDHAGLRRALAELFGGRGSAHRAPDPAAAAAAVVTAGGAAAMLTPRMADVRVLRLERGGDDAFVLMNERSEAVEVTATLPGTGVPEIWDPDTGAVAPAGVWRSAAFPGRREGGTAVSLRIEPKATQLVVLRAAREPVHAVSASAPVERVRTEGRQVVATVRVDAPGPVTVIATDGRRRYRGSVEVSDPLDPIPLDGEWTFGFDRAGAPVTARPLGSWTEVDSNHSGSARYEKEIALDPEDLAGRGWDLDLGEVHEVAEIVINGVEAGSRLWSPYRADVTQALRAGHNVVRIRVTNTGANARGQALESGLIGPVFLRPRRLVDVVLTPAPG